MKTTAHRVSLSLLVFALLLLCASLGRAADGPGRWPAPQAAEWLKQQGWLRGSNFLPSSAINQLEMWQAATFDEATIDRELGYAENLGFNSMRVFLHDLPWQQDAAGFAARIDRFLTIADRHHIKVLFVLFDSCWYPLPYLGSQMAPRPYTHNSGWVQSPGVAALQAPGEYPRLHAYVTGVIKRFGHDARIVGWDVWNEPDNWDGGASARPGLEPANKFALVEVLLPQVFAWAREGAPTQPLTSGVWAGDWSADDRLSPIQRIQLENSDVVSFHNYGDLADLRRAIDSLRRFGRPSAASLANEQGGTRFYILVDGKLLETQTLSDTGKAESINTEIPLSLAAGRDNSEITVKFQTHPGKYAGGIFDLRVVMAVNIVNQQGQAQTLVFDQLPARTKFPVRVLVSAFQWGRSNDPKVQSAGPVTQEFSSRSDLTGNTQAQLPGSGRAV